MPAQPKKTKARRQLKLREGYSKRLLAVEAMLEKMVKTQAEMIAREAKNRAEEAKRRKEAAAETKLRAAEEAKRRKALEAEEAKRRKALEAEEAKQRKEAAAEAKLRAAEEAKQRKEAAAEAKQRSDEINKKIDKFIGGVDGKLAILTEDLVSRHLIPLLKQRGIAVDHVSGNTTGTYKGGEYKGRNWELDNMAVNGEDIVVGEVKQRLRRRHVGRFAKRTLGELKVHMMPEYKDKNVYGSMAALQIDPDARKLANELGLFLILLTSGSAEMVNDKNFKPKKY